MWIVLSRRCGLVSGLEGSESVDLAGLEGDGGVEIGSTVSGLHELESDDGGLGRDGDELEEGIGAVELTVFDAEALGFEDAEELLDGPTPSVPVDDLPGVCGIGDLVGGQQPPMHRLDALRWLQLDGLDQG